MRISDWSSDVCSSDLGADYDLAVAKPQARNGVVGRRSGEVANRNAVRDSRQPLGRLRPGGAGDPLQPLRRDHEPVRGGEAEPAIEVPARLQLLRFVLVEAVLMMDERRAPEAIVRHHRIERAPIIGEDEVRTEERRGGTE